MTRDHTGYIVLFVCLDDAVDSSVVELKIVSAADTGVVFESLDQARDEIERQKAAHLVHAFRGKTHLLPGSAQEYCREFLAECHTLASHGKVLDSVFTSTDIALFSWLTSRPDRCAHLFDVVFNSSPGRRMLYVLRPVRNFSSNELTAIDVLGTGMYGGLGQPATGKTQQFAEKV